MTPCLECHERAVEVVQSYSSRSRAGRMVTFPDAWSYCHACGLAYYTSEQSLAHSRAREAAFAEEAP